MGGCSVSSATARGAFLVRSSSWCAMFRAWMGSLVVSRSAEASLGLPRVAALRAGRAITTARRGGLVSCAFVHPRFLATLSATQPLSRCARSGDCHTVRCCASPTGYIPYIDIYRLYTDKRDISLKKLNAI